MKKKIIERLQSKVVVITTVAIIGGIIKHYIPGISDDFQIVTDAMIAILSIYGVFNDPTNKEGF